MSAGIQLEIPHILNCLKSFVLRLHLEALIKLRYIQLHKYGQLTVQLQARKK